MALFVVTGSAPDAGEASTFEGPTTIVLDDFNRLDEDPLSQSGAWAATNVVGSATNRFAVVSQKLRHPRYSPGGVGGASLDIAYRTQDYPGDHEVYATYVGGTTNWGLVFNIQQEGSNAFDGYALSLGFAVDRQVLDFWRATNDTWFLVASTEDISVQPGDTLLARRTGATMEAWHRHEGGWTRVLSAVDANYWGGKIGVFVGDGDTTELDDFGGGVVGPNPIPPSPTGSPNPPILDDFNRASENPVSQTGNWSSTGINGGSPARLMNQQLQNFAQPAMSFRSIQYFGSVEASARIGSLPSSNDWLSVFVTLRDVGTSGWDGYELRATRLSGTDRWEIRKITNGSAAVLATTNFEIALGVMDLRREGSSLEFWWKPSDGLWEQKLSATDGAFSSGYIGAGGQKSGALDDFAGGNADLTVTTSGWPYAAVGATVSYQLDVENAGPSTSMSTSLALTPPSGVTITSAAIAGGGSCSVGTTTTCELGALASSSTTTISVGARLDIEANLSTGVTVTSAVPDWSLVGNTLGVRTVGFPPERRFAAEFRPALMFSSGSAELWRPVAIDGLLAESFTVGFPYHQICASALVCDDITSESGFATGTATENSFLDLHGSGDDSYTSHSCRAPGLNDCDSGPTSVLYYEPTTDLDRGYRYLDYWWFYRWNDSKWPTGDHEGDWEGLTVVVDPTGPPSNTGPPVAAYALYAHHDKKTWSAYLGNPANTHTPAYVGEGTHSSNPSTALHCGNDPVVDHERCWVDPPRSWGRNDDGECGTSCVVPLADSVLTWLNWPGRWGPNTEGEIPGGGSPRSPGWQSRYHCVKNYFGGDCPAPPFGTSFLARRSGSATNSFSVSECAAWKGDMSAAVLCDPVRLKAALEDHELDQRGEPGISIKRFGGRVVAAPGLTQAIGSDLGPGDVATVTGRSGDRRELFLRIRRGSERWAAELHLSAIPHGTKADVSIHRGDAAPVVRVTTPAGPIDVPVSVRRVRR